ncbi:hypothetical protein J7337_007821 [Fusarium musae]|uniref:Uncharacterized protein n=1 Tax=Fusarium musae TaxID=1042133 RepID=A0A9P8DHI1_9HYPO|nr:hypothetical protein J7337_007821 [Fusarium musae]KAG9502105.1 hypothetical protein J7337_007821 [Fusarium musae]
MSNDTDYVALGVAQRSDRSGLETLAELALRTFPSVRRLTKTQDPNIFLFSTVLLDRVIKAFVALFVPLWLVLPTIILQASSGSLPRSIVFAFFIFGTSIMLFAAVDLTKHNFLVALIT